jgi:hypothetical protein
MVAHRPKLSVRILAALLALMSQPCAMSADEKQDSAATAEAEKLFVRKVLPLLQERCLACHGEKPDDIKGDLDVSTREGLLTGGESGEPSLIPGDAAVSPLYQAIRWESLEMPPKENDRLTAAQIEHFRQWIDAGAPWPSEERIQALQQARWGSAEGVQVVTSGGLSPEWTNRRYDPANLWAYQPLWRDETGRLERGGRNPVDVLIDERLAELELKPASPADRRTLIRRAAFDLIGLPPTPAEVEDFLADPASDDEAFAEVVERLLASPHYGEQQGRRWLDVVRYADSAGYANDYERGNAWRYRDYVVRAFNDDKPYDEFIREQLAGDEIDPDDPEMLVAVGFLRMGPWELTGMEVAKVARQRFLDDVTDTVGQVFLAHMLQCARCHDHKFDPTPTRDYYSIQAVFATTQLAERAAPFLPDENLSGFDERKCLLQRRDYYQRTLEELDRKQTLDAARAWLAENDRDPAPFEVVVQNLGKKSPNRDPGIDAVRREMQKRDIDPALIPPRHVGFEPADFGLERVCRKGLERLKWRLERYEPYALSVYSGRTPELKNVSNPLRIPQDRMTDGELEQTCILTGGDPFSPAAPVEPGVLSAVLMIRGKQGDTGEAASAGAPPPRPFSQLSTLNSQSLITGRRLALANWIASPENPLTARVMVNRLWQQHFGQGIAGNPNNFGTTGKKPTHPELLDWLAGRFMEGGWSVKQMHRVIMLSDAYRRSSSHTDAPRLAEKDSSGTSYAVFQPRRLDAEELRDSILQVSGELNLEIGGIPIRPEMNLEAALQPRQVMGTFAEAWQPSPLPEQRHRRSLYALRIRGQRDPFLEVFNAPSPDICSEAREASTVTPQVFALFNSRASYERALAFAHRLEQENGTPVETVRRAFELAFQRPATQAEIEIGVRHWEEMTVRHRSVRFAPREYPPEVVREAVEENTGEKFAFVEPLEAYADFVPDLQPADAPPELRGLAELCLVLLNSNEFAYVY